MHSIHIRSLRGALLASTAVLGLGVSTAYAQAQQQQQTDEDEAALEEIIVTGSRIKRAGFDTLQPAVEINSRFLDD
ncbi:MAG: hypothetical protein D6807_07255, partial [Alphaproteobacteria bacterium]